ncbi:hypothetical protein EVJ58_g10850 [Rhodofomes roseus]|uniref:Uncharacterized protein n=1 Tax=Rhodofomes roseus TaxID=34475 RepID=A0A4Y9XLD8_9APHY|nr:hypothetical protein EVJ58_g10850 [Rhodofomes roseus]
MPAQLPPDLVELARMPFKSGASYEHTSNLGLHSAPYSHRVVASGIPTIHEGSSSRGGIRSLEGFLRELNGGQFEYMVNAGYTRMDHWKGSDDMGRASFRTELEEQIEARLVAWKAEIREAEPTDQLQKIARDVYLHWGAKHICCLVKEVEASQKGLGNLQALLGAAELPWQCMNMS